MAHFVDPGSIRLSACHPLILGGFLKKKGFGDQDVLDGTGINPQLLATVDSQLTFEQYLSLIQRAIDLTGDSHIGLEFGRELKVTSMGLLGLGFLACGTFTEAMHLLNRIVAVTNPAVSFGITEENNYLCVNIEEAYPWYDHSEFMVEVAMSFIHNVVALYDVACCGSVKYELRADGNENDYRQYLTGPIRFQTTTNRVSIPLEFANRPLPLESSLALKQSVDFINKQLDALDSTQTLIIAPIKHIISASPGKIPCLQQVSDQLHMTPRTLNRRLKSVGTSFKEVATQMRQNMATEYLSNKRYTIDQISSFVGYKSASNFSKAFRGWTGHTPSEYREKELSHCAYRQE